MIKKRKPDNDVEAEPLEVSDVVTIDDAHPGVPEAERPARRSKRRFIWPFLLASALAASSWTIAQAATLPPLPADDSAAGMLVTDAAQSPIDAPVPSAKAAPFGPQLEVILPPPPPPPPPPAGKATAKQRKAAAASAASSGLSTTAYCDAQYGATASASSVSGLLAAANAERANFGLGALSWSSSLESFAQQWSDAMAAAYVPGNPGAGFYHDMVPSPGGQNIVYSMNSAHQDVGTAMATAHSNWMKSPGHCKNILRASFTTMGAATTPTSDPTVWYTTVNFQ